MKYGNFNFDFYKNTKKYILISVVILVVIILATLFLGVQLDIQFRGGAIITYSYNGSIEQSSFENVLEEELGEDVNIQQSTDLATGLETLVVSLPGTRSLTTDELIGVNERLSTEFPENTPETVEIKNVEPTIGREFLMKCIVALVLALVLVMLYVAFRFRKIGGLSAGAMGVVALIHDCIVVFGVFVVCGIPINDNFIAVVLTILGFSLNATIVIYDRIRENKKLYRDSMPIGELVSKSINQSLTRSINTSFTAVVAMIVVTIVAAAYGVESIFSFSFPLIIGLISGAYSSICLAGPLWVKWQEHKLAAKKA